MGDFTPVSKQDDCEQYAGVMLSRRRGMRVDQAYLLALAERWLRPADQLDYMIRRGVIPVPFEAGRSVAPASPLRRSFLKHSRRVGRSIPHKGASMRSNGSLSEVQATIGRCLRAEYALERSMPTQIANLLEQFEQRDETGGDDQTAVLAGA